MIRMASVDFNVKSICNKIDKGEILFDNAVQRGYVWDKKRKSLLIDSIVQGYPVPAFYAVRTELPPKKEGKKPILAYDMLDGKQRCGAIHSYVRNEFELTELEPIVYEDSNGTEKEIDITGFKFKDLPLELQDVILSYSFVTHYFDDISDEEISSLFARLNNGKPLSAIELTRVKAKSLDEIKELAAHQIFVDALSEKALNSYTNEDVVIKSLLIMTSEEAPSLETKNVRPTIETIDITEDMMKDLKAVLNRIRMAHDAIHKEGTKEALKIAKRLYTRTHMLTLAKITDFSIKTGLNDEDYVKFVRSFYNGTGNKTTIDDDYNTHVTSGSGKKDAVSSRLNALEKAYKMMFGSMQTKPQTKPEVKPEVKHDNNKPATNGNVIPNNATATQTK